MSPYRRGPDPYLPRHGDDTYDVRHYDLDLRYNVSSGHLDGRAHLSAVARQSPDRIVLDLHGLIVSKVTLDGRKVAYRHRSNRLQVHLPRRFAPGQEFTVAVTYRGRPTEVQDRQLGRTGWEELTGGSIVAAQPHGAPSWFPCNDRPDNKATYRISATVPARYLAVANGRLVSSYTHAGSSTWTYEQSEPTPTYLAVLQTGRYVPVALDGPIPIVAYVPPRLRQRLPLAFGRQGDMVAAFSELFGPYPFPSYSVVVTDDDLEIPLESQTLSTFGANHLRAEWDSVRLVAHELAHQWFGNCLTLRRWQDIWLHEGFACYSEWLWSEVSGLRSADEHARLHHRRLSALPQDLILADPGPRDMFDDRVYKRGALALHALRLTVGDGPFFQGLRDWVAEHRYGTVDTGQFLAFMSMSTGQDVGGLLTPWLWEGRLPPLP